MAEQQKPTPYVVLRQTADSHSWNEYGRADGRKGEEAIKLVAKRATGSEGDEYSPGDFKAVPVSTWESEGNNLTITSETKVVTSFLKPTRANGSNGAARKPRVKK